MLGYVSSSSSSSDSSITSLRSTRALPGSACQGCNDIKKRCGQEHHLSSNTGCGNCFRREIRCVPQIAISEWNYLEFLSLSDILNNTCPAWMCNYPKEYLPVLAYCLELGINEDPITSICWNYDGIPIYFFHAMKALPYLQSGRKVEQSQGRNHAKECKRLIKKLRFRTVLSTRLEEAMLHLL